MAKDSNRANLKQIKKIEGMLDKIHNRRAKIVISRILQKGFITTEELNKKYGYEHPPRAARDVREVGIPLETFRVKSSDGRSIAAYRFGNLADIQKNRLEGRTTFSIDFKRKLYAICSSKCYICNSKFDMRYLQVDHKVPYEVSGESGKELNTEDYSLICGSCNRAKSWSCEHCINWKRIKNPKNCLNCYWASPDNYSHIAMIQARRIDLVWNGSETKNFDMLDEDAKKYDTEIHEYIKKLLNAKTEK